MENLQLQCANDYKHDDRCALHQPLEARCHLVVSSFLLIARMNEVGLSRAGSVRMLLKTNRLRDQLDERSFEVR